jgi:hypothetical protein
MLAFGFFCQQRQQHLSLSVVGGSLKSLLEVPDVLTMDKTFDGVMRLPFGAQREGSSLTWQD